MLEQLNGKLQAETETLRAQGREKDQRLLALTSLVSSTCTTASAPAGTGAPVLILTTCPARSTSPTTPPATLPSPATLLTPAPSADTTAYPSLTLAGKGGRASLATTS